MSLELKIIPKDSVFIISEGCYSDYMMRGIYKALEDIDPNPIISTYMACKEDSYNWKYGFYEWLVKHWSHLFERVPYREWYIADYEFKEDSSWVSDDEAMFIGNNAGVAKSC